MNPHLLHLESAIDGTLLPADRIQTTHQGRPLWVRYDLEAIGTAVDPETIAGRAPDLWRYHELLPLGPGEERVTLGEGMSPLLAAPRLGAELGLSRLSIKDEAQLPTGSFKSRGQAVAISVAKALGATRVAIPTAGNAGGAMAAYAARAGLEAWVFMPKDTPRTMAVECALAGARVFLVDGLITDCGKLVKSGQEAMGWLDISTLKEPYRLEGKKTMGLELAEQRGWTLPDVILYPTGGGTGLVGMWKAFDEMEALGWIPAGHRPRMVAVQSDGCAPLVRAFEAGARFAEPFAGAETIARGLRVPAAVGDFMVLDAVRASGGRCVAVEEGRILEWMRRAVSAEGISVGPEAAACVGAAEQLAAEGWIAPGEEVVLFNCGALQKYPEIVPLELPVLDPAAPPDWGQLG